jgi:hypothetical protein
MSIIETVLTQRFEKWEFDSRRLLHVTKHPAARGSDKLCTGNHRLVVARLLNDVPAVVGEMEMLVIIAVVQRADAAAQVVVGVGYCRKQRVGLTISDIVELDLGQTLAIIVGVERVVVVGAYGELAELCKAVALIKRLSNESSAPIVLGAHFV